MSTSTELSHAIEMALIRASNVTPPLRGSYYTFHPKAYDSYYKIYPPGVKHYDDLYYVTFILKIDGYQFHNTLVFDHIGNLQTISESTLYVHDTSRPEIPFAALGIITTLSPIANTSLAVFNFANAMMAETVGKDTDALKLSLSQYNGLFINLISCTAKMFLGQDDSAEDKVETEQLPIFHHAIDQWPTADGWESKNNYAMHYDVGSTTIRMWKPYVLVTAGGWEAIIKFDRDVSVHSDDHVIISLGMDFDMRVLAASAKILIRTPESQRDICSITPDGSDVLSNFLDHLYATLLNCNSTLANFGEGIQYLLTDFQDYMGSVNINWPGLPFDKINAAVYDPENSDYYMFSGTEYVKFSISDWKVVSGPKTISNDTWQGVPFTSFDAAVVNPHNNSMYFFKGEEFVRFNIPKNKVWHHDVHKIKSDHWKGLTFDTVDAAAYSPYGGKKGKIYFFSGDLYASYDIDNDEVDSGYPARFSDSAWAEGTDVERINGALYGGEGDYRHYIYYFVDSDYYTFDVKNQVLVSTKPQPIFGGLSNMVARKS